MRGTIVNALTNCMFSMELETGQRVLAHLSVRLRIRSIKIVKDDSVMVEISTYDLIRGRSERRLRPGWVN